MRLAIDLDGTICKNKLTHQSYEDVEPIDGAIEALQKLKAEGHSIIIYTARNMKTCNNSLGAIVAKQIPIVVAWLNKYHIPYDEIWPGKPNCDYFIDDKAITFNGDWNEVLSRLRV